MPIEFSYAAFRFGHSMVLDRYFLNDTIKSVTLLELLQNTSLKDRLMPIQSSWVLDWRRFFDFEDGTALNISSPISPRMSEAMTGSGIVPAGDSLPAHTLKRGRAARLPSGQAVASELGIRAIDPGVVPEGFGADIQAMGLTEGHPLWFYVLLEAERFGDGGTRLGPVGAHLVAETIVGLLEGDPDSYLNHDPSWRPRHLGAESPGIVDLLRFAKVDTPIRSRAEDDRLLALPG